MAQRLEGIDFDLKLGEIVGVAGLTGSGREELAGALVGERPSHVDLENIDGKRRSDPTPRQAKDLGVVLVLPNRASGAAILEFTMRENISLPSLARDSSLGFISRSAEYVHSKHWIEALDIRPSRPGADLCAAERRQPAEGRVCKVALFLAQGDGDRGSDERRGRRRAAGDLRSRPSSGVRRRVVRRLLLGPR